MPIGLRARGRVRAGGPRAQGSRAASWPEWAAIREQVLARWLGCQACGVRRRLDAHHVVKRSQGGSDFDLDRLVASAAGLSFGESTSTAGSGAPRRNPSGSRPRRGADGSR